MSKNLVITFPGGRGSEIPLLYFCAKKYEDLGFEKIFINHPLEGTLPYITSKNDILYVAGGTKDRYLSSIELERVCAQEKINCYIEENVGHRMEVMGDLKRNLEIISNVLEKI